MILLSGFDHCYIIVYFIWMLAFVVNDVLLEHVGLLQTLTLNDHCCELMTVMELIGWILMLQLFWMIT